MASIFWDSWASGSVGKLANVEIPSGFDGETPGPSMLLAWVKHPVTVG